MRSPAKRSTGFNGRRLRANLQRDGRAMAALALAGVDRAAVERFGLGQKEPYERSDGISVSGVVTYPLEASDGRTRYGYLNLPGVTRSAEHPVAWSPGEARSMTCGEKGVLVVVGSPIALFNVGCSADRRMLQISATASSRPDRVPTAWTHRSFWSRWDRIILCEDLPTHVATAIASVARRPVEQARGVVIYSPDGSDVTSNVDEWLDAVLEQAVPFETRSLSLIDEDSRRVGDFPAEPIALHGGFAKGFLYYPFVVERRRRQGTERLVHSYETLVLRSDGAVLEAETLPAPAGVQADRLVYALTDGTRITGLPVASRNATWSLRGIQAFAAARCAGVDPCDRIPSELLTEVKAYLVSQVALPEADDYWLAATFVILTHMFRVFDALPILLVQGMRGTGKTELAASMAALSFNAVTLGQGSAAALVRLTRECGGLVVLDDAEGLGGGSFSDLGQCLKVGYRSATARKSITLPSGRIETWDFFGPRVVTCTRGVDPVLGSRCISVGTAAVEMAFDRGEPEPTALRDELHALAMTAAASVRAVYERLTAGSGDRSDEIWSPLVAIATALDCQEAISALRRARIRRFH